MRSIVNKGDNMTRPAFVEDDLERLSSRNQTAGAWCGALAATLLLIGWCVLARFLPPPSPNLTGDALAAYWHNGTTLKIVGFVVCMWGGILFLPFSIAIAMQVGKIGKHVRFWAYTAGGAGIFGTIFVTVPFVAFMAVAFRPDRPVEVTQLFYDFAFIFALTTVQQFCVQNVSIGVAILQDRSATPVFPRWLAYFNFWLAFAFIPACLIPFFKTGPFAWNGILSFWVPVGLFVSWMFVMSWQSRKAIAAIHVSRAPDLAR
jgi:hypothetical protein